MLKDLILRLATFGTDPRTWFYAFSLVILVSAVCVVTRRSPVHAAVFLVSALLGTAGIFLTLQATFLFAVQIMVYTGGIIVLFLFAIMLVNVEELPKLRSSIRGWWLPVAFSLGVFAILVFQTAGSGELAAPTTLQSGLDNTSAVARLMFVDYLLPFEIVSVLLLVAMVGAIVLSKEEI